MLKYIKSTMTKMKSLLLIVKVSKMFITYLVFHNFLIIYFTHDWLLVLKNISSDILLLFSPCKKSFLYSCSSSLILMISYLIVLFLVLPLNIVISEKIFIETYYLMWTSHSKILLCFADFLLSLSFFCCLDTFPSVNISCINSVQFDVKKTFNVKFKEKKKQNVVLCSCYTANHLHVL